MQTSCIGVLGIIGKQATGVRTYLRTVRQYRSATTTRTRVRTHLRCGVVRSLTGVHQRVDAQQASVPRD